MEMARGVDGARRPSRSRLPRRRRFNPGVNTSEVAGRASRFRAVRPGATSLTLACEDEASANARAPLSV